MIDWKNVVAHLTGDIRVHPSGQASTYNSATPHGYWSPIKGATLQLLQENYHQLDDQGDSVNVYYRLLHPDWTTFKEWLRVYFNDLEVQELDPKKYRVYQTIIGIMIEGGTVAQVQGDIWFEALVATPNSFREQTLIDLWVEIGDHGFPDEPEDD